MRINRQQMQYGNSCEYRDIDPFSLCVLLNITMYYTFRIRNIRKSNRLVRQIEWFATAFVRVWLKKKIWMGKAVRKSGIKFTCIHSLANVNGDKASSNWQRANHQLYQTPFSMCQMVSIWIIDIDHTKQIDKMNERKSVEYQLNVFA